MSLISVYLFWRKRSFSKMSISACFYDESDFNKHPGTALKNWRKKMAYSAQAKNHP
jgi:hypothetical protein